MTSTSTDQPIQDLDQIDIVGKRKDGGMDVATYCNAISAPQSWDLDIDKTTQVKVLIVSEHAVAPGIRDLVLSLAPLVERAGAALRLTSRAEQWPRIPRSSNEKTDCLFTEAGRYLRTDLGL